ncbi:transporter substrate-binding domain-containing protein [Simiduia curdlanivorans]|uniref:Transporter substrate-binding domain-containing protein n=1 Tax=Simiduia curdlanivorans TaxID=1492769 RepID=A0ABV8V1U5_9GAMM|nr:transporter substrate-binding domain-containing protein [Simiduia curdlanivorans]MDN3638037.1 transporter substrate-binding domain-containing protein [Simiduia curdlanivorans]
MRIIATVAAALIGLALIASTQASDAGRLLLYPKSNDDWRAAYPVQMLTRALTLSGGNYQLQPGVEDVPKARNFLNLSTKHGVDVVWSMTSIERETEHLAIKIPLNRGLMGYRVALVRSAEPDMLASVASLEQLKQFTAGQMYVWSDTKILTSQGMVVPGSNYNTLFRMLVAGRFDFFPRSVTEVSQELARNAAMGISLDKHLLIRYPAAMYFFVNKQDAKLAADIERGLEMMLASGEFVQRFEHYYGDVIRELQLDARVAIDLHNPYLPADTPLCRRELWWADLCPIKQ